MADFEDKLSRLLDSLDEREREADRARQDERAATEAFIEGFERKRLDVIVPVFQELGRALKARGHDYYIRESPHSRAADGRSAPASVSLEIYLKGMPEWRDLDTPHLEYITQEHTRSIVVHVSSIDRSGSVGSLDREPLSLEQITPDAVRQRFLALFTQLVENRPE